MGGGAFRPPYCWAYFRPRQRGGGRGHICNWRTKNFRWSVSFTTVHSHAALMNANIWCVVAFPRTCPAFLPSPYPCIFTYIITISITTPSLFSTLYRIGLLKIKMLYSILETLIISYCPYEMILYSHTKNMSGMIQISTILLRVFKVSKTPNKWK